MKGALSWQLNIEQLEQSNIYDSFKLSLAKGVLYCRKGV